MGQTDLHEAVARAIYEAAPVTPGAARASWEEACHPHVHVDRDLAPAAAAAIRVVLAEATRSIEALEYYGPHVAIDGLAVSRSEALAALAGLEPPPLV